MSSAYRLRADGTLFIWHRDLPKKEMNYVLGGNGFIGRNVLKAFGALSIQHDLLDNPLGKLDALASRRYCIPCRTCRFGR